MATIVPNELNLLQSLSDSLKESVNTDKIIAQELNEISNGITYLIDLVESMEAEHD